MTIAPATTLTAVPARRARLSAGPTSRVREERRALRHTRLVKVLRLALPLVSGAIALGLVIAAVLPKILPISALAGLSLTADGLVMNTPRLSGHLGEGRRYEVSAGRAVQSLLTPSRLTLEDLSASLEAATGTVTIDSASAVYDTGTEILDLSDGIRLVTSDGDTVRLDQATVHLKEGRLAGEGGITINSPRGTIRAGAIDIADGGGIIRFTGGVSITIAPQS
jgi:lipopolysaccharide export system protein LptC